MGTALPHSSCWSLTAHGSGDRDPRAPLTWRHIMVPTPFSPWLPLASSRHSEKVFSSSRTAPLLPPPPQQGLRNSDKVQTKNSTNLNMTRCFETRLCNLRYDLFYTYSLPTEKSSSICSAHRCPASSLVGEVNKKHSIWYWASLCLKTGSCQDWGPGGTLLADTAPHGAQTSVWLLGSRPALPLLGSRPALPLLAWTPEFPFPNEQKDTD